MLKSLDLLEPYQILFADYYIIFVCLRLAFEFMSYIPIQKKNTLTGKSKLVRHYLG